MARKKSEKRSSSFWFEGDIKELALENQSYRRVVFTGSHSQLVVMNLSKGEDAEKEPQDTDTLVFIVQGKGKSIQEGRSRDVFKHDLIFVPANKRHNLRNASHRDLKAIVIYSPPMFADGEIQKTRGEMPPEKARALERAWEQ